VAVPTVEEIGRIGGGKILIGFLAPLTATDTTRALASGNVTSFAVEAIPRGDVRHAFPPGGGLPPGPAVRCAARRRAWPRGALVR